VKASLDPEDRKHLDALAAQLDQDASAASGRDPMRLKGARVNVEGHHEGALTYLHALKGGEGANPTLSASHFLSFPLMFLRKSSRT
jgi:hypothetical protein